jgi:starvation-inducible DNA-binding protein
MPINSPLNDTDRATTGDALQSALVDLIDLSLLAKQAHWTLVGPRFRSVHLQLDEVVAVARRHMDVIAERASAIGVPPDGRARTVVADSGLPDLKSTSWIAVEDVVEEFTTILETAAGRMRDRVASTAESDPVTQDRLIQAAADLEQASWMFQAERAS